MRVINFISKNVMAHIQPSRTAVIVWHAFIGERQFALIRSTLTYVTSLGYFSECMSVSQMRSKLADLLLAEGLRVELLNASGQSYPLESRLSVGRAASHVRNATPGVLAQLPDLDRRLRSIKTWHAEVDQDDFVDGFP